ncbi:transposase, partial [Methanosarcina sp. KYL-1]|uniref:transposase n=1 Tax=Methanosarcina sp. KYL-1 TaxID=2602068 RepID=UPI002101C04F
PRFFVTEEKALAKVQRKLSKLEKGTPKRAKALKAVQRVHERIANKREDFVQKVSLNLVRAYDLIIFGSSLFCVVSHHKNQCGLEVKIT